MSVVLYEGVVTTPRNLDQGARCPVPGTCPRSGWPARLAELNGFRVFIVGRHLENGIGNNPVAPRMFLRTAWCKSILAVCCATSCPSRGTRANAPGLHQSPSIVTGSMPGQRLR